MKLLSLGGSRAPAKLVSETVGLNIESDDFWLRAVSFIENMMDRIESIGPGPGVA
jgi:oligoendopeptidase F